MLGCKLCIGNMILGKQEWLSRFKKSEIAIQSQPRTGRPSAFRNDGHIKIIHVLIHEHHLKAIGILQNLFGLFLNENVKMSSLIAIFHHRLAADESLCYEYDPESKQQSSK